jgi:hypothetical protein
MELILAVTLAGPLGYFAPSRKLGLRLYLLAWALVFPIQTIVVASENPDDMNWAYPLVNAVILGAGIGLNRFASGPLRARRA